MTDVRENRNWLANYLLQSFQHPFFLFPASWFDFSATTSFYYLPEVLIVYKLSTFEAQQSTTSIIDHLDDWPAWYWTVYGSAPRNLVAPGCTHSATTRKSTKQQFSTRTWLHKHGQLSRFNCIRHWWTSRLAPEVAAACFSCLKTHTTCDVC